MNNKQSGLFWLLLAGMKTDKQGNTNSIYVGSLRNGPREEDGVILEHGRAYLPLDKICLIYGLEVIKGDNQIRLKKSGVNELKDLVLDLSKIQTTKERQLFIEKEYCKGLEIHKYFKTNEKPMKAYQLEGEQVYISKQKIEVVTDQSNILVQYPQIEGMDNRAVQNSVNSFFKSRAIEVQNRGEEYLLRFLDPTYFYGIKGDVILYYRITFNYNMILSVVFIEYQSSGEGYGSSEQTSNTFDLITGQELFLNDLFKPDSGYVNYISEQIQKQMIQRDITHIFFDFKTISETQEFYLTRKFLVIYFEYSREFPYAYGIQEFLIAYTDIESMMRPEIARRLLGIELPLMEDNE